MPATFPSHPGVALPLKVWRPRWFDGVALAVGSGLTGHRLSLRRFRVAVWPLSHEPLGLVVWCLPVTLAIAWLLRLAAPVVAAHLPPAGLALRAYGALARNPHRWFVTASSALAGGASHLAFDALEVASPAAEPALHLLGGLVFLVVLRHIARHSLIREWHGRRRPYRGGRDCSGASPGCSRRPARSPSSTCPPPVWSTPRASACWPWSSGRCWWRRRVPPAPVASARQDGSRD